MISKVSGFQAPVYFSGPLNYSANFWRLFKQVIWHQHQMWKIHILFAYEGCPWQG
jgi:hypothetical protein